MVDRFALPSIALASALLLTGCGASTAPAPGGNIEITITGLGQPGQIPQIPGQIPGQIPQIPGQIPPIPGQIPGPVAQIPGQIPLAPGTPDPGGLPPLPPLAPGATSGVPDPAAVGPQAGLTGSVSGAIPTATVPTSLSGATAPGTTLAPASPGNTIPPALTGATPAPATLATAPAAPLSAPPTTGGQNAPNPLTPTAQAISNQFGVRLAGYPDAQGLANLNTALSLYPVGATAGATINFTGQEAGSLGGLWQTGGLVTLYQTGVHVCAHELAHHIVEQNRARWGSQLKYLLRLDGDDFPQSAYAIRNAQLGNFEEVAAETVSYYAEGRWKPSNPQLEALLKAMITNQPGATA